MRNQPSVAKKVDKKSKTLFYGKLEGVVHGTNMIMGLHFPLHCVRLLILKPTLFCVFNAVLLSFDFLKSSDDVVLVFSFIHALLL